MKKLIHILIFVTLTNSLQIANAQNSREENVDVSQALKNMRSKQENEEERTMRIITAPITQNYTKVCTQDQMTRQRLRDIGAKGSNKLTEKYGNIDLDIGHRDTNMTNNRGTITNDVNVQIAGTDEERCL